MQFLDFTIKTIRLCLRIHRNGQLPETEDLQARISQIERMTADLAEEGPLTQRMKHTYAQCSSAARALITRIIKDEKAVRDISRKCNEAATDLLELLRKLQPSRPGVLIALKTTTFIWRKRAHLQELEQRLSRYRVILDTAILSDLK